MERICFSMNVRLETLTNKHYLAKKGNYRQCELYQLTKPALLPKPLDIPEDYIAYNPSAIWTTTDKSGRSNDIVYLRIEPNHSCAETSHLGKSRVRPYVIDVANLDKPLQPYYEAEEKMGEDAALTRINRKLGSGAIEQIWLLSCVNAQPFADKPDHVKTLHTEFYIGKNLDKLEHVADGPEWMKDIRISQDINSTTKLHIYGRPQPQPDSGNITYTTIDDIEKLNKQVISSADFLDENLLPIGSGIWGGVNDIIPIDHDKNILVAHRAWRTGESGKGRHYEAVLYEHSIQKRTVKDLGVLAIANMFPTGTIKADEAVDLSDVVFTGGGYNKTLQYVTFGVRDGSIGISNVKMQAKN